MKKGCCLKSWSHAEQTFGDLTINKFLPVQKNW
jgi:hypothetical protein